jgi:fluoride exporter
MLAYLWVALGGALGSVSRYWLSGVVAARWGETFPWGTLVVNVTGSVLIGFLSALGLPEGRWLAPPGVRLFFMVGVCGGYTTFSSFSLQTLNLLRDGPDATGFRHCRLRRRGSSIAFSERPPVL